MYYNWLDRWDERRMRRRDDVKKVTGLVLDPELVFPANNGTANQDTFCDIAKLTALDSDRFFGLADPIADVSADDQWIRFPSSISTGIAENDTVHAKVTRAGSLDMRSSFSTTGMPRRAMRRSRGSSRGRVLRL